jgi:hypothetical protein
MTQPLRRSGMLVSAILRGCEGKRRYPDEYVARGVGQILQAQNGDKLYIYHCKICRGWHLTKVKQRNEKHDVDYEYPRTRHGA